MVSMKRSDRIKIWVSCHKPTAVIRNDILRPIQLNAANSKVLLPDMDRDDTGENISTLNPMYCELTAQYWAFKNTDSEYYGFCHYRRYFSFAKETFPEDGWGNVVEEYPSERMIKKYGLDEKSILEAIDGYDIITTKMQDLRKMPVKYNSVYNHYGRAPHLHIKDLETMLEIIDEKFPEYSQSAHDFVKGHKACFCNMYIMKQEYFKRYAEWMFAVLKEFCERTDMSLYDTEGLRTPGHLSERLFNIFLIQIKKENPKLKIKALQSVYFKKTDPQEDLLPAFKDTNKTIPIVFAANNKFVPVFAVCLESLLQHLNIKYNYDVVLIESDVTNESKKQLCEMVASYKNVSLRFYDATKLLAGYELKANAHISVETYYRFLIQDALPGYDKVLYLDCDLVINDDISKLYKIDVSDYALAATRDPDFLGQINGANRETVRYVKTKLKMKNPYDYFQAGVLLFNEDWMRKKHSTDAWLKLASKPYMYNDQDVLNLECEGHVKYLDMKWGMIVDHAHTRVSEVISFAPDKIQKEYSVAHANPSIIHYAGFKKPWYDPTEDFAMEFWKYARKTVFYETLIAMISEFDVRMYKKWLYGNAKKERLKRKAMDAFDVMYAKVAPYGSRRWVMIRKIRGKEV